MFSLIMDAVRPAADSHDLSHDGGGATPNPAGGEGAAAAETAAGAGASVSAATDAFAHTVFLSAPEGSSFDDEGDGSRFALLARLEAHHPYAPPLLPSVMHGIAAVAEGEGMAYLVTGTSPVQTDASAAESAVPAGEFELADTQPVLEDGSFESHPTFHPQEADSVLETPETRSEEGEGSSGRCVVCWDARAEAVCVPCGHMAGCIECLRAVKAQSRQCPVCRASISEVIKVYTV